MDKKKELPPYNHVNGQMNQRLWPALPKSASFLDRLVQKEAAVDIWWVPPAPNSCANPLWLPQCRFGLARTSGLKQSAMLVKLFPAGPNRERRAATAVVWCRRCGEDSDEHPEPDRSRPLISYSVTATAGDAPRSDCLHLRRLFTSWPCRRAWTIVESHDGGGDADEDGSHDSRDEFSILFDLARKRLERIQNLPSLRFDEEAVRRSHGAGNPGSTCGVLWNSRSRRRSKSDFRRETYGETDRGKSSGGGWSGSGSGFPKRWWSSEEAAREVERDGWAWAWASRRAWRRSRRQEAQTPTVLLRSGKCFLHLIPFFFLLLLRCPQYDTVFCFISLRFSSSLDCVVLPSSDGEFKGGGFVALLRKGSGWVWISMWERFGLRDWNWE